MRMLSLPLPRDPIRSRPPLLPAVARGHSPSPPTASSLGERVGVRGAFASVLSQVSKRFRAPAGARVTSLLLVHARAGARANGEAGPKGGGHGCPESRRSHQEKTTPRWRALRPSMGYGCAGGLRGFPTAPPCAGGKLARIPAGHPADFPPPTRRAIGGPGEAARSCAQKQRQEHPTPALPCRQGRETTRLPRPAFALAVASGAHDAHRLLWGPSAAVRRGRQGRAAGEAMDGLAFSRGQEPARKARPRLTDFPPMDGWKAPPRGVVFSWLLLLDSGHPALRPCGPASLFACAPAHAWTSKREVARPPAGGRNRFESCESAARKAPLPNPLFLQRERGSLRT